MFTSYIRRASEIFQKKGLIEFVKRVKYFILWRLLLSEEHGFKYYTLKNHLFNQFRYDAPADPYKTISIRPREINCRIFYRRYVGFQYVEFDNFNIESEKRSGIGQIRGGDWDSEKYRQNVNKIPKVQGVQERFGNNMDWKDTIYYKYLHNRFSNKVPGNRESDKSVQNQAMKVCERVDNLYQNIVDEGYKSGHIGHRVTGEFGPREQLEVLVVIDRNGNICLWDGQHRFAIARVLDLEIPAHVVCRHRQWQKVREDVHNNGLPDECDKCLQDHPDLQDIVN